MTGWGKRGKKKMRKKGKANLKYHFKLKTRQGNYAVFITPYLNQAKPRYLITLLMKLF